MTQRERQVLQLIEKNPLISQQEIADALGITRSSAAVHISNLSRKGLIAGRGYVLRSGSYAVVVGGVNVDIGGRSFEPLVAADSNPGRVTMSFGPASARSAGLQPRNGSRQPRRRRTEHSPQFKLARHRCSAADGIWR